MNVSRLIPIAIPAVVIIGLIASLISFYSVQSDLVQARDNHRGGPLWMAVRLEFALLRFDSELAHFAAADPGVSEVEVNKQFDVLWSRWDLAHQGKAGAWLREIDTENQVIDALGQELMRQEEKLLNLQNGDVQTAYGLHKVFLQYQAPLHDLSLAALRETSEVEVSVREHLVSSANKLSFISVAIVIISVILVGYFWLNARAQRRIAREKSKLFVQAQAGYKAKSEFVATISHELRTPLTSIIGAFDLLGSGVIVKLPDKADGLVKLGRGGCDRLSTLIENLLDIDMFEKGALKLSFQPFDLVDLLEEVRGETAKAAEKNEVSLEMQTDERGFELEADWRRLCQAVCAVVDNAIKFSQKGGQVSVSVASVGRQCYEIRVIDNGIGIPTDQHEKIFDKFTLGDSSDQRSHAGVGNGLFIAKAVVEAHGGKINIRSAPGAGTEVCITVPAHAQEPEVDDEPLGEPELAV